MRPGRAALALTLLALSACDSTDRPGSYTYDGGPYPVDDLDVFRTPDAVPIRERPGCGGSERSLVQRRAEVILVVDRSGSMAQVTADGRTKWMAMLTSLQAVLPAVEHRLALGLVAFPVVQFSPSPPVSEVCGVLATPDIPPEYGTADRILRALGATLPSGATPTHAALGVAQAYYRANPDRTGRRYVLLATDGGPNCNTTLVASGCRCSSPGACGRGTMYDQVNCLDDTRTVATVQSLQGDEVQTFVVGLPGIEGLEDVLDAMAVAGGRPREGSPRYYPATSTEEITATLSAITSGLIECRFQLASAPPDPNLVDVRLNDVSLYRDPSHHDGWDWSDGTHTEILFYGMTCEYVRGSSGGARLAAVFGCPAPTPP